MTDAMTIESSRRVAGEQSAARMRRMQASSNAEAPLAPEFKSLDEASHNLYLRALPGPIRCRVDGSIWDVWQDGRSELVRESDAV